MPRKHHAWSLQELKALKEIVEKAPLPIRWGEVAQALHRQGFVARTADSVRMAYRRLQELSFSPLEATSIQSSPAPAGHEETDFYLRQRIQGLEKEIRALKEALGFQRAIAETLQSCVVALPPLPSLTPSHKPDKPSISACLCLSDWHIGEIVKPEEAQGNVFNWDVAQARVKMLGQQFSKFVQTMSKGYNISRCHVFLLGDFISGNIHQELAETNEFPPPEQAIRAGELLSQLIRSIAPLFSELYVYSVGADNHSRLSKEKRVREKYLSSFSFIVNTYCQLRLKEIVKGFHAPQALRALFEVDGFRFLVEHGDEVKTWLSIPYYGLERSTAQNALSLMDAGGFHYRLCGHWHQPAFINLGVILIVNGSLVGTNAFDLARGRRSKPSQVAFFLGKHGLFGFTPFDLSEATP